MQLPISYQQALSRYPEQTKEILTQLKKSKSKEKNSQPENLKWYIDWSVGVKGYSITEIFNGTAQKDHQKEDAMTIDELVSDYATRCHVCLFASKGHWYGYSKIYKVPQEILDQARQNFENNKAEKERFNALSEKQKQAEINDTLSKLRGVNGFNEIKFEIP